MKKLTLVLAFAFAAGMSFAQHTDDIDQWGYNNTAEVQQYTWDITMGNAADVDQHGSQNIAEVFQVANWFGGNTAEATQYMNDRSDVYIWQYGSLNKADVFQNGGDDANSYGLDNLSTVIQTGHMNEGYVYMHGSANTTYLNQWGVDNYAAQIAGGYGDGYVGVAVTNSVLDMHQFGMKNVGAQEIEGGSIMDNNKALLVQLGDNNIAYQGFRGRGFAMKDNIIEAQQISSYSYLDPNLSGQWVSGSNNTTSHYQEGNGNKAETFQNVFITITNANYAAIDGYYQGTDFLNQFLVIKPAH